ncbi:hypothetical protein DDZ14_18485 [Maritimibacter sp. 55A14]|uniref:ANTAR domain-containing response regulator n=1 Tax=Maritimibacter sp. 55A14 TaxID=2174844 RepID=UPI000D60827C|nr:ANTAR domain-containing protein [Maritimibacter sp. 55A14]PWE28827.1 hypothetical protein DDZ14_18485 [Maritimibacter sp. 55A14]
MKRQKIPNFLGRSAVIVHPASENTAVLIGQLERLGVSAKLHWPADRLESGGADFVFFDADRGYDQQFSWEPGKAPIPLIALMGSEAPGRIEWALAQVPSAYLLKPLGPNGIFCALAIAFHDFELKSELKRKVENLTARVRARSCVMTATGIVQSSLNLDSTEAFQFLRTEAMKHRISVENLCEQIARVGSLVALKRLSGHKNVSNTRCDQSNAQNGNVEHGGQ